MRAAARNNHIGVDMYDLGYLSTYQPMKLVSLGALRSCKAELVNEAVSRQYESHCSPVHHLQTALSEVSSP